MGHVPDLSSNPSSRNRGDAGMLQALMSFLLVASARSWQHRLWPEWLRCMWLRRIECCVVAYGNEMVGAHVERLPRIRFRSVEAESTRIGLALIKHNMFRIILLNGSSLGAKRTSDAPSFCIPGSFGQVLVHSRSGTIEGSDMAFGRSERTNVPGADGAVRSDGVGMADQRIRDLLLPQIPDLDVVVDAARVQFVASLGQSYGGDREASLDEVDSGFLARIPDANVAIVRSAEKYVLAATADVKCVDDLVVALVSSDALGGLEVPAGDVHVCRGREEVARVARPLQV
ncbi:WD40 repeat-like protein, partial [Aureobasidium melanogenum]